MYYTLCLSLTHCHIPRRGSHYRLKKNIIHEFMSLAGVLTGFRHVRLRRRHRTQPFDTCVGLGTERLTMFAHSVLVLARSLTLDLPTLGLCRGSLLLVLVGTQRASSSSGVIYDAAAHGSLAGPGASSSPWPRF